MAGSTFYTTLIAAVAAIGGFALLRAPRLRNLRRRYLQQYQRDTSGGTEERDGTREGQTP